MAFVEHNRQSVRLKNWDYAANGYYSVTICTQDRKCLFGNVVDGKMYTSEIGSIANKYWLEIPRHFPFVKLDEFIVMPNHVHGIIFIGNVGTQNFASLQKQQSTIQIQNRFGPQSKNLASIIRGYKIGVKKWAVMNNTLFQWQPRFYDHIIRDEMELNRTRKYIVNNPSKWKWDRNNVF